MPQAVGLVPYFSSKYGVTLGSESNNIVNQAAQVTTTVPTATWTTITSVTIPKEVIKNMDMSLRMISISYDHCGESSTPQTRVLVNGTLVPGSTVGSTINPTWTEDLTYLYSIKNFNADCVVAFQGYQASGSDKYGYVRNVLITGRFAVMQR